MQKIRSILLILFMLASSWYNSLVWAVFESQQSYFADELCEQKAMPENTCQGTCQLRELLQNEEEPESPILPVFTEELEFVSRANESISTGGPWVLLKDEALSTYSIAGLSEGVKVTVWRPPCLV